MVYRYVRLLKNHERYVLLLNRNYRVKQLDKYIQEDYTGAEETFLLGLQERLKYLYLGSKTLICQ